VSVYTVITRSQLEQFLTYYSVGQLIDFEGIPEGVENTNYRVLTSDGLFVLTLFETLDADVLAHVLQLLVYLGAHSLQCSHPISDDFANTSSNLGAKQAALFKWISGDIVLEPTFEHCYQIGLQLGKLHIFTENYHLPVVSRHDLAACKAKFNGIKGQLSSIDKFLIQDELIFQESHSLVDLPVGVIHGDLFRDNVLFIDNEVSALLDFYSASSGFLLLDIAITVNDWCVNKESVLDGIKAEALLSAYQTVRALSQIELRYLPIMLRAAALRFWLSRLELQHFQHPGVMTQTKDPLVFRQLLDNYRSLSLGS